jgi:hypothetical protein
VAFTDYERPDLTVPKLKARIRRGVLTARDDRPSRARPVRTAGGDRASSPPAARRASAWLDHEDADDA